MNSGEETDDRVEGLSLNSPRPWSLKLLKKWGHLEFHRVSTVTEEGDDRFWGLTDDGVRFDSADYDEINFDTPTLDFFSSSHGPPSSCSLSGSRMSRTPVVAARRPDRGAYLCGVQAEESERYVRLGEGGEDERHRSSPSILSSGATSTSPSSSSPDLGSLRRKRTCRRRSQSTKDRAPHAATTGETRWSGGRRLVRWFACSEAFMVLHQLLQFGPEKSPSVMGLSEPEVYVKLITFELDDDDNDNEGVGDGEHDGDDEDDDEGYDDEEGGMDKGRDQGRAVEGIALRHRHVYCMLASLVFYHNSTSSTMVRILRDVPGGNPSLYARELLMALGQ